MQLVSASPGLPPLIVIIALPPSSSVSTTVPAANVLPASAVVAVNADQVARSGAATSSTTAAVPNALRFVGMHAFSAPGRRLLVGPTGRRLSGLGEVAAQRAALLSSRAGPVCWVTVGVPDDLPASHRGAPTSSTSV
jgi:hypothetical protein